MLTDRVSGQCLQECASPVNPFGGLRAVATVVWITLLLAGGFVFPLADRAAAQNVFTPTAPLLIARNGPTMTLLPDGKVLVAGGSSTVFGTTIYTSAELYDFVTATWTMTGSMNDPRGGTATLLGNGKVLVTGGSSSPSTNNATAELYDPSTGTWVRTSNNMRVSRAQHTATLLADGRVLVAGGSSDEAHRNLADLYDPVTDTWSSTGSMTSGRKEHVAVRLPSGKILVVGGGIVGGTDPSAELYDPTTGIWSNTSTGSLPPGLQAPLMTLLHNGKVLLAGGDSGGLRTQSYLYDPDTQIWTATGSLNVPRAGLDVPFIVLPDGKVLACGAGPSAEVYDPVQGSWTMVGPALGDPNTTPSVGTLLPTGQVLVAGGSNLNTGDAISSAELFTPSPTLTPPSSKVNGRFHYSANGSAGGWSATKTVDASGAITIGPQAMEGNLIVHPGDTLRTGYDFTMPGSHPAVTLQFIRTTVTFQALCASGSGGGTIVVNITNQSYTDPVNSSAWYPSGDQRASSVYQGSIAVPDLCGGDSLSLRQGGRFNATVGSM